ncbi:G-PROTEIN-RECEP-F1-2 domain-containing protein [Aphelenchoides bicaudatus]|nr:G-PROTEIN-RECEP-F1-2 domain-containing protein [Aphelenchoides bicaudatus]
MHLFQYNDTKTLTCQLNLTEHVDNARVGLVGVAGTSVALVELFQSNSNTNYSHFQISLFQNLILFYVFSTSRKLRRQNYANPVILAFFDCLVSLCYILTSSVNIIALRIGSVTLIKIWATYMRFVYCTFHFSLTVSNFLLVVASLERYLANAPMMKQTIQKRLLILIVSNKTLVILLVFILAFGFKATLYFETDTIKLVECHDLESYIPIWLTNTKTRTAWARFWLRKICTIILPFIVLAFCNAQIVFHLQRKRLKSKRADKLKQQKLSDQQQHLMHRRSLQTCHNMSIKRRYSEKRGVRVATRTLCMVVGCYLVSNSMNTVINIWEYCDSFFLRHEHYYAYLIASDFSVLLTIVGCALRLPIYVINDGRIRKAIFRAILRLRYCGRREHLQALATDGNLDKWSIVIVSNSLRSNLTGAHNDMAGKKTFEQLAVLVQDQRKFLVQMTVNLGAVRELPESVDENLWDSTDLTDLHEEHMEMIGEQPRVATKHPKKYSAIATPSVNQTKWRHRS